MYVIYPVEGLANRMRVVCSAVRLCSQRKKRVVIRWWKDKRLMCCDWPDIFQQHPMVKKDAGGYRFWHFFRKIQRHSKWVNSLMLFLKRKHILEVLMPDEWERLRASAFGLDECWLTIAFSFSVFYTGNDDFSLPVVSEEERRVLTLNNELEQRLTAQVKHFNTNTVGVHIRRTDNRESISNSPTALFLDIMRKEFEHESNTIFFVCTDDDDVKQHLAEEFNHEALILPDGPLNRNSQAGVQQAALELFALSKTREILGSYNSSFSEMAALIGGIKLETVKK